LLESQQNHQSSSLLLLTLISEIFPVARSKLSINVIMHVTEALMRPLFDIRTFKSVIVNYKKVTCKDVTFEITEFK